MLNHTEDLHQQVMAETELIIDYSHSPIVTGNPCRGLAPGYRLPDNVTVNWPDTTPCGLHHLAHQAGHTLMLLAGPVADARVLVDLRAALQKFAKDSPLFAETFAIATSIDAPVKVGRIDRSATDQLGIDGITLLAIRPDGYVGLRSDQDHLRALQHYCTLIQH
jgi:hypothetical protein